MHATFLPPISSATLTLAEAAEACGFQGFDWQQTIKQSPGGVAAHEAFLNPLMTPYLDPPEGGYTYQYAPSPYAAYWSLYQPDVPNANPYYYSLMDINTAILSFADGAPAGCAQSVDPPAIGCITYMSDGYVLNFYDRPHNTSCSPLASCFAFETQLVGVCGDESSALCSSPDSPSIPLYKWTWQSNYNGKGAGGVFDVETSSFLPPEPGNGAGGVTVTSINGVQLPTPVASSQVRTTASGLAYSRVSQTFNGTVTLTNIGDSAISGPLQILFTGMPSDVTLVNATQDLWGTPYLTVPTASGLAPGQSVTVSVQFKNSSNATINFTPAVYSGIIN